MGTTTWRYGFPCWLSKPQNPVVDENDADADGDNYVHKKDVLSSLRRGMHPHVVAYPMTTPVPSECFETSQS